MNSKLALITLQPNEKFWGVRDNEPIYDGYLRVGFWDNIDLTHPYPNSLGISTAIIEFDLNDLPVSQKIDKALLFIEHVSLNGASAPVSVYGTNRKFGNPSDFLEISLDHFTLLGGPFEEEDIILDVTDFIRSTYEDMGLASRTSDEMIWMGADFILGNATTLSPVPGFRNYTASSLWVTLHTLPS